MQNSAEPRQGRNPWVFRIQLAILAGFTLFACVVVAWISRLIYISWVWQDVFSASIGIALVAIPIFIFLLGMFNYVFWGILRGGEKEKEASQ